MRDFKAGESDDWLCDQGRKFDDDVYPSDLKLFGKEKDTKPELP